MEGPCVVGINAPWGEGKITFLLGVNRSELAQSVKAVYGASFKAERYLSRFFDVEIRLPHPDRKKFIESQTQAIWLGDFLSRTKDSHGMHTLAVACRLISWS